MLLQMILVASEFIQTIQSTHHLTSSPSLPQLDLHQPYCGNAKDYLLYVSCNKRNLRTKITLK